MNRLKQFDIAHSGAIAEEFLKRGIHTFDEACLFVQNLPYHRNTDKDNPKTVFIDNCGTCSTKHALLKQLCIEHNEHDIKLVLGIFKMNGTNTPAIYKTITTYNLEYIPEAHTYLTYQGHYFDFTKVSSAPADFSDDLIFETEILPDQINHYKIHLHQDFLRKWLHDNTTVSYSFDEIWSIREQCIANLSK